MGTYHPFAAISGIGTVEIEDSTGTATARFAQQSDVPGHEYYTTGSAGTTLSSAGWTLTDPIFGAINYSVNLAANISPGLGETATVSFPAYSNATASVSGWNWTYSSNWPYYPTSVSFTVSGTLGRDIPFSLVGETGFLDVSLTVTGTPIYFQWAYDNGYGVWQGPQNVLITPGINIQPFLVVTTAGGDGAVVTYPSIFTTGGADPTSAGLTYSIPSGSTFPVGQTTVTATATDGAGRTSSKTFVVDVIQAPTPAAVPVLKLFSLPTNSLLRSADLSTIATATFQLLTLPPYSVWHKTTLQPAFRFRPSTKG